MSLQQTNTSFPTHYLQIKLAPTDGSLQGGEGAKQGSRSSENVSSNSNLLREVRHSSGSETAMRATTCRADERLLDNSCETGPSQSCIASTIINITPSINTAPVSSNSFFVQQQTAKDFLSEEAKQAAANLRDTMAAIADRRVMFFSECPKSPASPQHSLNKGGENSNNNNNISTTQQSSLQRSTLLLERNKDNHNFEVTSRDDFQPDPLVRDRPHFVSERTMSGYYFPNLSRKSGGNGRMSLKTAELLKNCPPLELYTTAPITASTLTPALVCPPKVSPPSTKQVSPPTLLFQSSQPVVLQISEPASISLLAAESCHLRSSPEKSLKLSAPSSAAGRRERTDFFERSSRDHSGEQIHCASELSTEKMHGGSSQNGEHVHNDGVADSFPLSVLPDRFKLRPDLEVRDVCFYSAPEAFSFQENEHETREGMHRDIKAEKKSGDSPPSTPNSGSLSSSMKSASISKLKAFFSDNCNAPGSDGGKQMDVIILESGIDPAQLGKKSSAQESNVALSRVEKNSFKNRKSASKQQHQQQGSPVSKHKKSPIDKPAEPHSHKETWKGRVAKTIRRYGSGSILLSSDIVPSPPVTEENKSMESGVFGVPLECCEVSQTYDLVPLIVEACVKIVEDKGLDNQGIYRVPGNTGAIKELQDDINKDPKGMCMDSEKWQDVNLVTSLLKLFFRKLPDSLITDRLYEAVIATTRLEKSEKRMLKLKRILHDMPERNFNTFAFLSKHLRFVASHEESNKMDAHNLAIMFGPTLVRPRDNNIAVMARNMADQCRVVETIIVHCDWFFSSWDEDVNVPMDGESEELTPIIDEKMVAKAQSLGSTCQKSSSASSLHHFSPSPSSSLKFPHSSSLASLPTSSNRNLESVVQSVLRAANKKWKFGSKDQQQHVYISSPIAKEVQHHHLGGSGEDDVLGISNGKETGQRLKNSYSDISLSTIRSDVPSPPSVGPFGPSSKKGIITRMTTRSKAEKPPLNPLSDTTAGKRKFFPSNEVDGFQKPLSVHENVSACGHNKGQHVPVQEIEMKIDIVRHNMYNFNRSAGQFFGMADNRDIQKLPWEDTERKGSKGESSPSPVVNATKPVEKQL